MNKVIKVCIKESLVREICVPVNNFEGNIDEAEKIAHQKVVNDYKAEKIILGSNDFNGVTLIATEADGIMSEWKSI